MNKKYIQNRTNWCWAVACKMVGEQFIRTAMQRKALKKETFSVQEDAIVTHNMEGLRKEIVDWDGKNFLVDACQHAIVINACSEYYTPGDANLSGDDNAKERGIKYVVTGDCESSNFQVVTIGEYDAQESLLFRYEEQIKGVFMRDGYIVGNAILYPKGLCHSFVLLDWTNDDEILLYDPWDGRFGFYPVENVFSRGFETALGRGIVKWIQYID